MSKQEAGRLGGLQTYLKHGAGYMSETGKKGGRPRARTIRDITQPTPQLLTKGESLPSSLSELKKAYKLRLSIR